MCLYPKQLINRKYTATAKNGGIIPPVIDERAKYIMAGCGRCMECKKQKQRDWMVRLMEEIKMHNNGKCVTLTISNEQFRELNKKSITLNQKDKEKRFTIKIAELEGYEKDNAIATYAVRHFLERYRKKHGVSVRHWLITELGHQGTENVHLHGILWTNDSMEEIEQMWMYGHIHKGKLNAKTGKRENFVNGKTANYCTKYVMKTDLDHPYYQPKVLCSQGIGKNYIGTTKGFGGKEYNKFKGEKTREFYKMESGHEISIPKYYRRNIWTDDEREKLWMNSLDKKTIYVLGIPISTKDGGKEYMKVLEEARQKNNKFQYGSDKKNIERDRADRLKRRQLHNQRLYGKRENREKVIECKNGIVRTKPIINTKQEYKHKDAIKMNNERKRDFTYDYQECQIRIRNKGIDINKMQSEIIKCSIRAMHNPILDKYEKYVGTFAGSDKHPA